MAEGAIHMLFVIMKAVILPYDEGSNKYRKELIRGFESVENIEVSPGSWHPVSPLFWSVFAEANRPEVVHIHWLHLFFLGDNHLETIIKLVRFPFELLLLRVVGIRIIWTVHNLQEHENRLPHVELAYRTFAAHVVSGMIVHCERASELVIDKYRMGEQQKSKVHVVPHGNYIEAYENSCTQHEAKKELDLPQGNNTVFLFFGQIRPYKCVPHLIREFNEANLENSILMVAGNPSNQDLHEQVENLARETPNVYSRLQFIPDDEVQLYLNAADVVVLPYEDILTSGSAVLAISFGRPVIAPSIKCLPELLSFQLELLYRTSEPTALRSTLEDATKTDLNQLGTKAAIESNKYDWKCIAEKTASVYTNNSHNITDSGHI